MYRRSFEIVAAKPNLVLFNKIINCHLNLLTILPFNNLSCLIIANLYSYDFVLFCFFYALLPHVPQADSPVILRAYYEVSRYILPGDKPIIAEEVQLTERQVKNWFQHKSCRDNKVASNKAS